MSITIGAFTELPSAEAGPEAFREALQAADWSAFTPARDLPSLRAALTELERTHGVTEAHRFATERIKALGALLRHPDVHQVEMHAHALSPCGRYLAVGSWTGDDPERGGALQIWETATGRCVNVIDYVEGGVGWPQHVRTIQWSADSTRIAVSFRWNDVGVWDPFGKGGEPIAAAAVTSSARPLPFALAPDGERAFLTDWDAGDIPAVIVTLSEGTATTVDALVDEATVDLLVGGPESDDEDHDEDDEDDDEDDEVLDLYRGAFWSRDGARIYGVSQENLAYSIGIAAGTSAWRMARGSRSDPTPAWSQDERLVAVHPDGTLVIADAVTGRPVAERPGIPGASNLSWGAGQGTARLAVVVTSADFWRAEPRVGIFDETGEHRYDLDVSVERAGVDADLITWAWAPDGQRAACLTTEGRIQVWALGERPELAHTFDAPTGTEGLLWTDDGVVIAAGGKALRFVRAANGEIIGDHTLLREVPAPRPLVLDGDDYGAELMPDPDPTFALDTDTWAVAFEPGLVVAPPGREHDLDAALAWTIDRRFAWPVRWGRLDIVPDVATAAERIGPPLDELLDVFRDQPAPETAAWPPPNTATVDDLFQATHAAFKEFEDLNRAAWGGHFPDQIPWLVEAWQELDALRKAAGLSDDARGATAPTEQDIAALAKAHAELLRTPRAQRSRPAEELVRQAARCHHISAILDLLPTVTMPANGGLASWDRPMVALSVLRLITTGVDKP